MLTSPISKCDTKTTRIYQNNFPKNPLSLRLSAVNKDPSWPYHASNRVFIAKKTDVRITINSLIAFYASNQL